MAFKCPGVTRGKSLPRDTVDTISRRAAVIVIVFALPSRTRALNRTQTYVLAKSVNATEFMTRANWYERYAEMHRALRSLINSFVCDKRVRRVNRERYARQSGCSKSANRNKTRVYSKSTFAAFAGGSVR